MKDNNYKDHMYALIIIGGGGTRLWPKSRVERPKQFLNLFGKKTLAQITAYRFGKILPWERIFFVTTKDSYKKELKKEIPEAKNKNIIVEPAKRNTGPAHALGALHIFKKDPDAVIVNEYSDHLMTPEKKYFKTVNVAAEAAYKSKHLVAIGIKPDYPNVGYGYIKKGKKWERVGGRSVYKLDKFTEKPKLDVAKKYLASGDYFWNAGQYTWRADAVLDAYKKHAPEIYERLQKISKVLGGIRERFVLKREYKKMPNISVDYAISEKAEKRLLVVADYAWTDIGDWKEVWENLKKDDQGNVILDGDEPGGEIINIDTSDAMIHKDGRLIAVVDVDDIIIVDTKDALLVCNKSKAQSVKKIVEMLKKEKKDEYL